MRVSVILLGAVAALVSADTAPVAATTTVSGSAADPSQAAEIACIQACTPGDVNCTAKCIAVGLPPSLDGMSFPLPFPLPRK